jgi:hypothetical protein
MQSRLCWITTGVSWEYSVKDGKGGGGAEASQPFTHTVYCTLLALSYAYGIRLKLCEYSQSTPSES